MTLDFARYVMQWKKIGHLPVENKQGALVGIISISQLDGLDKNDLIKDHMTTKIISCLPSCTKEMARSKLEKNNIHSLLVVEEDRLVGIITDKDV
jgi:CBS domain-containing protein